MAHPTLISMQALLLLNWDRFFYTPWYRASYLYVQPLDLNVIKSFANQSLWLSLDYDGDGSWILDGMLAQQSLVIIHDGPYMKEVSITSLWQLP
jgi:hypothetical protein